MVLSLSRRAWSLIKPLTLVINFSPCIPKYEVPVNNCVISVVFKDTVVINSRVNNVKNLDTSFDRHIKHKVLFESFHTPHYLRRKV